MLDRGIRPEEDEDMEAISHAQCTNNGGMVTNGGVATGYTCRGGTFDGRDVKMTIWRRLGWGLGFARRAK